MFVGAVSLLIPHAVQCRLFGHLRREQRCWAGPRRDEGGQEKRSGRSSSHGRKHTSGFHGCSLYRDKRALPPDLTTLQSPHKNFKLVNKSEEKNSKIVGWFRAIFESRVRTLWRREGFTCQALQHAGGGDRVLHVQLSALVEVNQKNLRDFNSSRCWNEIGHQSLCPDSWPTYCGQTPT